MDQTPYIPGQSLFNLISEYITEAPSPAPAPREPTPCVPSAPPSALVEPLAPTKSVVIAEPVNSRNLLLENDKLKQDIKSMKQELKVLKSMCGLDRRLKLTKIREEDLHKYYRGNFKSLINGVSSSLMNYYDQSNKDIVILNKSLFDLEFSRKSEPMMHGIDPMLPDMKLNGDIIPRNGVMVCTVWEDEDENGNNLHSFGNMVNKLISFTYGTIRYELDNRSEIKKPHSIKNLENYSSIAYFGGPHQDINEWFNINITFPKLADFMKIENMNTIDIDIYKMKGIYVITYE